MKRYVNVNLPKELLKRQLKFVRERPNTFKYVKKPNSYDFSKKEKKDESLSKRLSEIWCYKRPKYAYFYVVKEKFLLFPYIKVTKQKVNVRGNKSFVTHYHFHLHLPYGWDFEVVDKELIATCRDYPEHTIKWKQGEDYFVMEG